MFQVDYKLFIDSYTSANIHTFKVINKNHQFGNLCTYMNEYRNNVTIRISKYIARRGVVVILIAEFV